MICNELLDKKLIIGGFLSTACHLTNFHPWSKFDQNVMGDFMEVELQQKPRQGYKLLTFLSMIYLMLIIAVLLTNKKLINFPIAGAIPISVVIAGSYFVVADIIAEVYGYLACRRIIIQGLIALGLFSILMNLIANTSSVDVSVPWANIQDPNGYLYIFGNMPRDFLGIFLAYLISSYINAYLISKWKILLKGRYFWLRSIGSSCIGSFLFSAISDVVIAHALLYTDQPGFLMRIILTSFLLKIATCIILAYPATLICAALKRIEGVDVYDYGVNYNPFKTFSQNQS